MYVLLVEDNQTLACLLRDGLVQAGFNVDIAILADEAQAALQSSIYEAVILDLGLPDMDGLELLREIRAHKNNVPVLILTARDTLEEKIAGLNLGADDYLTKPFAMQELIARLHALLRRPAAGHGIVMTLENIRYDPQNRQIEVAGKPVKLSKRETTLLDILMRAQGRVVPKEKIEVQIYSFGEEGSANSIEVLIHRLRKKLQEEAAQIEIHTLRGIGYMMTGTPNG